MIVTRSMDFLGRFLLAALFLLAAANKFVNTDAVLHHMDVQHVPQYFLPLVIALEICAGLAILIGWQLWRWRVSASRQRSSFTWISAKPSNAPCSPRISRLRADCSFYRQGISPKRGRTSTSKICGHFT